MRDVTDIAHVTGRRLNAAGSEEKATDIQDVEEGANHYILARAMDKALADVKAQCARYVTTGRVMDNNQLACPEGDYVLTLDMPDSWNIGVMSGLTNTAHDYVTCICVHDLFSKINPNDAPSYLVRAQDDLTRIKELLECRTRPVRTSLNLY